VVNQKTYKTEARYIATLGRTTFSKIVEIVREHTNMRVYTEGSNPCRARSLARERAWALSIAGKSNTEIPRSAGMISILCVRRLRGREIET
jgi:hypothetical protein